MAAAMMSASNSKLSSQRFAQQQAVAPQSFRLRSRRQMQVLASSDRSRLTVKAALATRMPTSYIFEPVDWISTLQSIVLPVVNPVQKQAAMEEECPWDDSIIDEGHSHPMYSSHLANRMAVEPARRYGNGDNA